MACAESVVAATFSTPVNSSSATSASAATTIHRMRQSRASARGSRSGRRPTVPNSARVRRNHHRPAPMPTAAERKPMCQPKRCCSQPVTSGPAIAPMLMAM